MATAKKEILESLLLVNPKATTEAENKRNHLVRNFLWFALIASINHALTYVVTSFAVPLLSGHLGGVICGLTWSLNAVSGLTVATPITQRFGWKIAMILSFWGYTLQIVSLYLAVSFPSYAWHISIIGAVLAGVMSAVWWTAQGVCFELTCRQIVDLAASTKVVTYHTPQTEEEEEEKEDMLNRVRAELSAQWTTVYQLSDILVFLSLSAFPLIAKTISIPHVLFGLCVVGIATALLGHTFDPLGDKGLIDMSNDDIVGAIFAVPRQFVSDARALLLAPFVFGFGITTAMFAYYINGNVVSSSSNLGNNYIGLLEAFSYFVAASAAFPYAYMSNSIRGGQHWVFQFGSLAFLLSGAVVLVLSDQDLSMWRNILIIRALYGLGRGVFEGACRAVYAEIFTGHDLSIAFSGQTLLAGLSGGICFFAYGWMSRDMIAGLAVFNGILAILCFSILLRFASGKEPIRWSTLFSRMLCSQNHTYSSAPNTYSSTPNNNCSP